MMSRLPSGLVSMNSSKRSTSIQILLLLCLSVFSGNEVQGVDYDYSFTRECLVEPLKPQYNGGIVVNPEFHHGIKGWSSFGGAQIETRKSNFENKFVVALNRSQRLDSISQKFNLLKDKFYTISAWLRVSHESVNVAAVFKTRSGSHYAGWSVARSGCWSMLKGGVVLDSSGPAELYFESDHPSTELWADNISLQPFTQEEWTSHRLRSIEKVRKSRVKIRAVDTRGTPLVNATINIRAGMREFPLGNSMSNRILTNPAYQEWFLKRFRYAVFENEMKWHWNEPHPNEEHYELADGMLQFAKQNDIKTRGHNVVWENDYWLPDWAKTLDPNQLEMATKRRQYSIMKRYKGKLIHWDVVNENLHFSYLERTLGDSASSVFYKRARTIDGEAMFFLNDFNTIENQTDKMASPSRYLAKVELLRSQGFDGHLGIGLQGHFFSPPNSPSIRSALDALATAKLPIWISELDVEGRWPEAANYLEEILRELHAHPAVEGIMIWAPWSPPDCYRMCITDSNFKNLPAGDVVDKLINEWNHGGALVGTTDSDGYIHTSLFHGDYELRLLNHTTGVGNSSKTHSFKVASSQYQKGKRYVFKFPPQTSSP